MLCRFTRGRADVARGCSLLAGSRGTYGRFRVEGRRRPRGLDRSYENCARGGAQDSFWRPLRQTRHNHSPALAPVRTARGRAARTSHCGGAEILMESWVSGAQTATHATASDLRVPAALTVGSLASLWDWRWPSQASSFLDLYSETRNHQLPPRRPPAPSCRRRPAGDQCCSKMRHWARWPRTCRRCPLERNRFTRGRCSPRR